MDFDGGRVAESRSDSYRPQARVALALLEVLRDMDRPGEILDDENVSLTLPRRFGLSDVVDAQIRRYEREARHNGRVPAVEVEDLIRLATRRADADELFARVGRSLTAANGAPAWRSVLPERLALQFARQRIRRRLKALFGTDVVSAARGRLRLQGLTDLLVIADPSGGACALVTGLSQAVSEAYLPGAGRVVHTECLAWGRDGCSWSLEPAEGTQGGTDGR